MDAHKSTHNLNFFKKNFVIKWLTWERQGRQFTNDWQVFCKSEESGDDTLEVLVHRKFLVCFSHAILTFWKEANLAFPYLSQRMHLSPKSSSCSEQGIFHHWGHCFRFMLWIFQSLFSWWSEPLFLQLDFGLSRFPWYCSFSSMAEDVTRTYILLCKYDTLGNYWSLGSWVLKPFLWCCLCYSIFQ